MHADKHLTSASARKNRDAVASRPVEAQRLVFAAHRCSAGLWDEKAEGQTA